MATQTKQPAKASNGAGSTKLDVIRHQLDIAMPRLKEVAPRHLKPERVARILLAAISKTPAILNCTPESILQFAMKCSETGLEPIGAGGAWPIPYGNVLTFVPDYRGLINCARRAKCVKHVRAEVVYENDEFEFSLGLDPSLSHTPARTDRGELNAAYAVLTMPDDTKEFVVMLADDVQRIKARSKAANSGPWKTDEPEMWKKTVIRRAMKPFAGASREMDAAIEADDQATGPADINREPITMPKGLSERGPASNGHVIDAPTGDDEPDPEPIPGEMFDNRGDAYEGNL